MRVPRQNNLELSTFWVFDPAHPPPAGFQQLSMAYGGIWGLVQAGMVVVGKRPLRQNAQNGKKNKSIFCAKFHLTFLQNCDIME
jgi:hypothetical protein